MVRISGNNVYPGSQMHKPSDRLKGVIRDGFVVLNSGQAANPNPHGTSQLNMLQFIGNTGVVVGWVTSAEQPQHPLSSKYSCTEPSGQWFFAAQLSEQTGPFSVHTQV